MTGKGVYAIALAILLVSSATAGAQDFELNPGWIEGTVQIGESTITYGNIWASGCDSTGQCHSASTSLVVAADGKTATYRLTVQGGVTYSVGGYVSIPAMQVHLPSAQVSVAAGETAMLDRIFTDWKPGTVHGAVTVTGGALSGGGLSASAYDSLTGISATSYGSISSTGTYSYTVGPGQVSQYAWVTVGGSNYALPYKSFTMPYGGDVEIDYTIDIDNPEPGSISGTISVNGGFVDYFYVYASGPNSWRWAYVYGADGSFRFDDLQPGNWWLYAYAYDNMTDGGVRAYAFPYHYTEVQSGQEAIVDFSLDPAFVAGTLTLGDYGGPQSSSIYVSAHPVGGTCCPNAWFSRWFSGSSVPESVDYGLFVDPARTWTVRSWGVSNSYYDASTWSYNSVWGYLPDAPQLTIAPGEEATQHFSQLDFDTGTLTLRLRVAGGGPLASPSVYANGTRHDANGQYLYSTYGNGHGQVQNTADGYVGTVKLTLAPGKYTFGAYAYVDGSWTSFGSFTMTIEPGSDVEQDISAPTLTVEAPAETCATTVTVSGTVSDTSGVQYLRVNGVDVAFDAAGNWSTTVAIGNGANTIVVEAADVEGNKISVTRTVSRLGCNQPPVAEAGGPYDTTEGTSVTLDGSGSSDPDGDTLTYEWDLDNDGTFDFAGATVTFLKADDFSGQVTLRVSDGEDSSTDTAAVVVRNVAPAASVDARAMVTYETTLRFAGQPGNVLCLEVSQAGQSAGGGCATRHAGDPNAQLLHVSFTVNLLEPFSAALTFHTASRRSGATPVWWVSSDGLEKIATFVTTPSDPASYQQTLALPDFGTRFSAVGGSVAFSGSASDPGADTVTLAWSFGDGGSATSVHGGPGTFTDAPAHTFAAPGTYNVVLTATDDDGGTGKDQIVVTIP